MNPEDIVNNLYDKLSDKELFALTTKICDEDRDVFDNSLYSEIAYKAGFDGCNIGASKLVLWNDADKNYVVKIPFKSIICIPYEMYTDCDEDILNYAYGADTMPMEHADCYQRYICDSDDYCSAEEFLAEEIPFNLSDMIFPVVRLVDDEPFYIAERAVTDVYDYTPYVSQKSKDSAKDFKCDISKVVLSILIEQYGASKLHRFLRFVNNWCINDLHDGNFMYDKNGMLRVIDYSGYHEDFF